MTLARATVTRCVARSRWTRSRATTTVRVGVARASSEDADGGEETTTTRGAGYYKGFVTEPVETTARELASEERDIWTPTINLVMRSAGVLTALFVGFLASNGLPPFDE